MAGINKAILIGRLGSDPEVRYTPSGVAVANFSIATSEEWKDKDTGERRERTEWHRIVAWRRLGEICGEYLSKGRQVYIEATILEVSSDVTRELGVSFHGGKQTRGGTTLVGGLQHRTQQKTLTSVFPKDSLLQNGL